MRYRPSDSSINRPNVPTQTVDGHSDRLSPTFEFCMLLNYKNCIPPLRARRNSSQPLLADTLSVKFLTFTLSIPRPTRLNTPFILCSLMMPCWLPSEEGGETANEVNLLRRDVGRSERSSLWTSKIHLVRSEVGTGL